MKVGVFTPLLSQLPLDQVLTKLKALNIDTVELGTGNYPGDAHCKLSMLDDASALATFKQTLADQGVSISALSCHGNPLHPNKDIARAHRAASRQTILLAEKLGVPIMVDFSGCPGDSPDAKQPNWVTCPWPPDYSDLLKWQWDEIVAPYWVEHGKFAADHGVKIAIEMHPGFVAYNPETMLKLRSIAGPSVGCNFDPSHLFWQQIDPVVAVRVLGDAIFHVHAKDTQIFGAISRSPECWIQSLILTSAIAAGSSVPAVMVMATWWREFVSTLRLFGYDNVLSIEHEDSLLSPEEGLTKAAGFLNSIVIREQPAAAWWV